MITDINSEDQLVQKTFAEHLEKALGWESVFAWNEETFGPFGSLGRTDTRDVVLARDLRAAMLRLNPEIPDETIDEAVAALTRHDFTRTLVQQNEAFYRLIREGVPVTFRDPAGQQRSTHARVVDFRNGTGPDGTPNNRFLAVRELKITGLRAPSYNRRADLVCFVNGLPLVFIELKAVYKNIRAGFDNNLRDYLDENVIGHAFAHNAFLIVSNGHRARYGSITSKWEHFYEWKRQDENDKGAVEAEVLLNGMLAKNRLLDLVENFILFDSSKSGGTRKIVARNHQVLGVNKAVASVQYQEELKKLFPPEKRLAYRVLKVLPAEATDADMLQDATALVEPEESQDKPQDLALVEHAHPDLGKLGVFWHTQGSGKSYSMAFFAEKVRRQISAKFTFLLMTDREDLDGQIYKTFAGCDIVDPNATPRASSGSDLKRILTENHPYVFSLIHKFNQDVDPKKPYSKRDDIIVISDEAHRTQAGKLARNMRLALPNASFIGFTGTPLFKNDNLTKRIFGDYVSRYDFKRSEEDGATKKLVYENRGEKLGIARLDLNDRIADAIAKADLNPDKKALLEKLLGQDYEVITAPERLEKLADDFVEHCATRWESGKSMLVCIDKITCGRMWKLIMPRWQTKLAAVKALISAQEAKAADFMDADVRELVMKQLTALRGQADWMEKTIIEIIISEGQNEVADFKKWGVNIIPHRTRMKRGFEVGDNRIDVETAFKDPGHPFRVAIVCAMWLTGFDVECLSTLYIDKPMKAHTLMQAIARANRVYPGKDFGLIVDYNGMLKSLREALAQYALGDEGPGTDEIVAPVEERVAALAQAIDETEAHFRKLGFEPNRLLGAKGFMRIEALADAVDAVYTSDDSKNRFEIMARQVFLRFKALVMEPAAFAFSERHDNIETIYKKLTERRDTADITEILKELQLIVSEAISTQSPESTGNTSVKSTGKLYDLSKINLERLRDEFEKKVKRKATAIENIKAVVEAQLEAMLKHNPLRMDYYKKYTEIIAEYNHEKDRVTIEETFAKLMDLAQSLDAEQQRAAEEGLSEDELALFDLLKKPSMSKAERERVKEASQRLLDSINKLITPIQGWTGKEQTQAEVEVFILDQLSLFLPRPPFSEDETQRVAKRVYNHIWRQSLADGASW